jgi:replicative DNA helicase
VQDRKLEHQFVATMANERADVVLEHRVSSTVFSDPNVPAVYEAVVEVATKAQPGHSVTKTLVRRLIAERGMLRAVGGEEKLESILGADRSLAFAYMRRALLEYARLRRLHDGALTIAAMAKEGRHAESEAALRELADLDTFSGDDAAGEHSTSDLASAALRHYLLDEKDPRRLQVPVLSDALGRPAPGSLVVVGGQTGAGKSSLVLLLADAYEHMGEPAGIVSLEDPEHVWGERLIARAAGVSVAEVERRGGITRDERDRAIEAVERLRTSKTRWALLDQYDHLEVLTKMRRLVSQGARAVFVDYLQLMNHRSLRGAPRAVMMAEIAKDLKSEAKRLNVPLFLCSQIRRPESQVAKSWEPTMHHLKESGDIENMAEGIVLLWKESDQDHARTLGKIAKLKSGSRRPRFELIRDHAGAITNLLVVEPPPPKRPGESTVGRWGSDDFES